jgi:hypothetical protein
MLKRLAAAIGLVSARRHALAEDQIRRLEQRVRELKASVEDERAKNRSLRDKRSDGGARQSKTEQAKRALAKSLPDGGSARNRRSDVGKADRRVLEALMEARNHLEFVDSRLQNLTRRS